EGAGDQRVGIAPGDPLGHRHPAPQLARADPLHLSRDVRDGAEQDEAAHPAVADAGGVVEHLVGAGRVAGEDHPAIAGPSRRRDSRHYRTTGLPSGPSLFSGGSTSRGSRPSSSMPSVARQKSRGGNCTGATAPSRKNRSRGEVLNSAWAPPRVMAVRVTRVTASPTKYLAR